MGQIGPKNTLFSLPQQIFLFEPEPVSGQSTNQCMHATKMLRKTFHFILIELNKQKLLTQAS